MVKKSKLVRVGPAWIELEGRVKERMPWMKSPELTDRIANGLLASGDFERWARIETRQRKKHKNLFRRLFW